MAAASPMRSRRSFSNDNGHPGTRLPVCLIAVSALASLYGYDSAPLGWAAFLAGPIICSAGCWGCSGRTGLYCHSHDCSAGNPERFASALTDSRIVPWLAARPVFALLPFLPDSFPGRRATAERAGCKSVYVSSAGDVARFAA